MFGGKRQKMEDKNWAATAQYQAINDTLYRFDSKMFQRIDVFGVKWNKSTMFTMHNNQGNKATQIFSRTLNERLEIQANEIQKQLSANLDLNVWKRSLLCVDTMCSMSATLMVTQTTIHPSNYHSFICEINHQNDSTCFDIDTFNESAWFADCSAHQSHHEYKHFPSTCSNDSWRQPQRVPHTV